MKLTLSEPKYLTDSISIISELVNEGRFRISQNGMELAAMDPANVAMVIFKLLGSCFTEFEVEGTKELTINLGNLKPILKRAGGNDMLTLELIDDSKLSITIKGKSIRTFSVPILELEEREQKIPQLEFGSTIQTKSKVLNDAIEDAGIIAESVTLVADKDKLMVQAEGDLSKAQVEIANDEETKIHMNAETAKAKYSIEYLKKVINGSKLSDDVVLRFSNDYPVNIEYKQIDKVNLSFILAPRVEND